MKIRRERTHQSGLTNLDFRTKGQLDNVDHFEPSLKFTDFGTMSKTQYKRMPSAATFKEQVAISGGWLNSKFQNETHKSTRYETANQFYTSKGKKFRAPIKMGMVREAQLEDVKWNDKVFTGDTAKNTATLTYQARQRELETMNDRYKGRQSSVDPTVHERLYRNTFSSAQHLDTGTLENKISLLKVKDARKAIRRRYASRTNVDKLFSQYDKDGKGFVTAQDLHFQASKIGLGMSLDEAQVMVQSAKQDKNSDNLQLNEQEFKDLIFSQDEALNVNLKYIKPSNSNPIKFIDDQLPGVASQEQATENKLKYFLQKGLKNVTNDLFRIDENKTYTVDINDMLKVVNKRVQIPKFVTTDSEGREMENPNQLIVQYAQKFQGENGKIDYKGMIDDLMNFDYIKSQYEEGGYQVAQSHHSQRSGMTDAIDYREPKSIFDEDYIVLDQKKVPQNMIEQIENRMVKVNRRLKKQFGDQAAFEKKVKESVQADANGNVSVDHLRDFILELCEKDLIDRRIYKKDVEGFLSAFNYNCYGATNIDEIAGLIYTRDDLIPNRLAERKRANPPPSDLNNNIDVSTVQEADMHNMRVKSLMNQMEDKVFNGKVKLFHVFRQFDKDGDGYVSYEDFENCIRSIKIDASKQEIASMMKLIDKKNNGYLNFSEFSKVFTPSMSETLVNIPQNDTYFPNLHPNKQMISQHIQKQTDVIDTIKGIRQGFQPDADSQLIAPTRFSAKPNFGSTFGNFQHERNCPGFISEDQRLGKSTVGTFGKSSNWSESGLNAKLTFQQEDKFKYNKLQEARIASKRANIENLTNNLLRQTSVSDTMYQQKLMVKAARTDNYNKLCHINQ